MKATRTTVAFLIQAAVLVLAGAAWIADAAAQASPRKDLVLTGDAKCTRCHDADDNPQILEIAKTKHGVRGDGRTPTCTSCHGESESHINKPADATERPKPDRTFTKKSTTPVEERNGACLTCHRGTARTRWEGSAHHVNDVPCASCHQVHAAADAVLQRKTQPQVCYTCHREQRADSYKISTHPIKEGKVACSDCHNPHGGAGPGLLKRNTLTETGPTCHADKRGPFLWEHQPVVESCTNCHTPHGSNLTPLLISRAPFLCQSCHDGEHGSGNPIGRNAAGIQGGFTGASPSNQALGRACLNCHSQIHGSNSPAGGFLQR
ncbi:MAG: DmsE family decaheme c-type cytochrome [Betaproteobacteria bacterium]|nr:DmsE family decaheme c-type cytochrome [Betaproteobacteria bacterium]